MKLNKQELIVLAFQTPQNFDNEGVLMFRERQDGFFRRPKVWENGVTSYRLATHHESERTLWLKAIQTAPYDSIRTQVATLRDRLNKIRPHVDIQAYRMQRGIVTDLYAETKWLPKKIYIEYNTVKGLCVRYGTTEVVERCSNPCFSKTILFRASDGLTGDAVVRIVVYDVMEPVSETAVPMGSTSLTLATIQDSQRLRVALSTRDNRTVGFVTLNGWSLEPSYVGSPIHTNDKCIDVPHKIQCHRRSQSLPPRLGLKLKWPSYGHVLKQNFVNSHQVTYRFHSGLGGEITVHEVMAEARVCFQLPAELLLVQEAKDVNSSKAAIESATANKVQAEDDNVSAMRALRDAIARDAGGGGAAAARVDGIQSKVKRMIALWDPNAVEESLSVIGWPQNSSSESEMQTTCTIKRLIEQLSGDSHADCAPPPSSSSSASSATTPVSPGADPPPLSSSVPDLKKNLEFHSDYFESDRRVLNHSFRSPARPGPGEGARRSADGNDTQSLHVSYN